MEMARSAIALAVCLVSLAPLNTRALTTTTFVVKAGDSLSVPGTSIHIRVLRILDFSSQGCEGGPRGCPDRVELDVFQGADHSAITLLEPHTAQQQQTGLDRKTAFGVEFILLGIHVTAATVRIVAH
jgi:hypothetical protein